MSKNAVGNLSVLISANATGFDATVTRVGDDVKNLHKHIKPPKPIDLGITRGVVAAGAGLAGMVSVGGLVAKTLSTIEERAQLGAAGAAFGLSAERATGLLGMLRMVGGVTRENIEGLTQFGQRVSDAYAGVGAESARLFDGLSVQAKDIINLPIDEQFYRVHAAIRQLPQPLQMAKLALIGGTDSMKQWLLLLSKSPAEVRKMAEETKTSSAAMRDIQAAQEAVVRAGASWDQAWAKMAASVAPVVEAVAELVGGVKQLGPELEKLKSVGDTKPGQLAKLGAGAMDFGRNVVGVVGAAAGRMTTMAGHAADTAGLDWLGAVMKSQGRDTEAKGQSFLGPQLSDQLNKNIAAIDRRRAMANAGANTPGRPVMSAPATTGNFLIGADGPHMPEGVRNERNWEAFDERKKAFDEVAKRRHQALEFNGGGEFAKMKLEAELLQQRFAAGLIGQGGFLEGMNKLVMDLDGVMDHHEQELPNAMLKGSQEVESLLSKAMSGQSKNDPAAKIEAGLKRLEAKQMTEERLAREFGRELEKRLQIKAVR